MERSQGDGKASVARSGPPLAGWNAHGVARDGFAELALIPSDLGSSARDLFRAIKESQDKPAECPV